MNPEPEGCGAPGDSRLDQDDFARKHDTHNQVDGGANGEKGTDPEIHRTRPDLALAFLKDAYQLMSGNDPSPATVAELWDLSRGRAKATKDIIPPFQKRQDLEIDEESIKTWMEKLRLCIEECH